MIMKLNRRSSGAGATAYLLSLLNWVNETRAAKPEILDGDPEIVEESTRISGYAQPYLSGEASWGEDIDKVGRKAALACVMAFIRLLTAGLPISEFALLIVLHCRTKGCDVHFVLSKVHLQTGLQFRFYRNTDYDEALKRDFRRHANLTHGWSDPEDPENRSLKTHPSPYAKPAERHAHEEFDDRVVQWVRSGLVTSREGLIALLRCGGIPVEEIEKENGILGIKITYERRELTLLGGKYTPGSDYEAARCHRATRGERSREDLDGEIAELGEKLDRYGSRRAAEYSADFAGGNRLFDGDPEAGLEYPAQGVSIGPGTPGECADGGAGAPHEAAPQGHSPGAGPGPSVPHGGVVPGTPRPGRDASHMGAAVHEDARDAEPAADFAGVPPSPPAGPKGQDPSLSWAAGNVGGSGTGREARPDGDVLPESGGHAPSVAHPSQATETITHNSDHEHGTDINRLIEIIAELLRSLGKALSGAEQSAAAAERTLRIFAEGAGRGREAFARIGGNLSKAGIGVSGPQEAECRGKDPVDDDYQAACREFGGAVEEIGEGDYEALEPDAVPPPRPPLPKPEGFPKGFEPSR